MAPIRVLVVDDEEQIRRNFRAYLEDSGYCVLDGADGQQGLDMLSRHPVDIVLTDLRMGAMDGLKFIAAVKDKMPDLPIVVVSGTGGLQDAIEAMRQGVWDYVVKPVHQAGELDVVIKRSLERARLLAENRRHREHLEELVEQRTQELRQAQEQFIQAQKMEAIARLAGGMAHDLRNQLTVIKGYCELVIRQSSASGKVREDLEEVLRAADRAVRLIGDLMAFSRQDVLQPEEVPVARVIGEIAKALPPMLGEDLQLSVVSHDQGAYVRVDPARLAHAVVNLALNARDAMPGGGLLTITTGCKDVDSRAAEHQAGSSPGAYVAITVSDTGTGMSREVQQRIFDPFFTTKEMGKGTGLGLSMVHGFVRQSGGFIDVKSEEGKGSEFTLCLPRVQPVVKPIEAGKAPQRLSSGGRETVLVVEDDQAMRSLISRVLRTCGYTVLEAGKGEDALAILKDKGPLDLVITDVVMPGMNGIEFAERVRAMGHVPAILFVSGHAGDALAQRGLQAGQENLLVKPFELDALASATRRILDNRNRSSRKPA